MYKLKYFSHFFDSDDTIETQINNFLKNNPSIKPISISVVQRYGEFAHTGAYLLYQEV